MADTQPPLIEFFYNSSFSAKFWHNPASIDGEEQNKKLPLLGALMKPNLGWKSVYLN